MLLIIDNFDSFTYNLYQFAAEVLSEKPESFVVVKRSDTISVEDIRVMNPDQIILSPGPGRPSDARLTCDIIEQMKFEKPILGVCLGLQCLAEVEGAAVVPSDRPTHGKTSLVRHDGKGIFHDIPSPFCAVRYHSLVVSESSIPKTLEVSARTGDGEVMGLRLKRSRVESVQFHPESVLTENGKQIIRNFIFP